MKTLSELESLLKEIHKKVCSIEPAEYTSIAIQQASINGALLKAEDALREVQTLIKRLEGAK